MGFFPTRARQPPVSRHAGGDLSDEIRSALPARFDAVAEALASQAPVVEACAVVGRDLARDGASLGECLEGLRVTCALVCGCEPGFDATRAIATAWSESTLGYLHQLSCEDPLTGLASLPHVRSRLAELYRGQRSELDGVRRHHALVVVDVPGGGADAGDGVLTDALRASRLAETARSAFPGTETIGRLGLGRVVVLAARDDALGRRTALLGRMLSAADTSGRGARVWIEGLPGSDAGAAALLDELTRR